MVAKLATQPAKSASTTFNLMDIVRPNLRNLEPYRCARDDYSTGILLDANENSFGPPLENDEQSLNRYPDPHQIELRTLMAEFRGVAMEQVFAGVGSDEAIDLLMRIVCVPGKDSILITPPTYGMYKVSANINDVRVQSVPLTEDFQLRVPEILDAVEETTRLIFVCTPGNPTAKCVSADDVRTILDNFKTGLVVVDEAYIDFADEPSFCRLVSTYPNLVVLQTLSKAFGLAGIRLGFAFADCELISMMNKVKAPYNVNRLTSDVAIAALRNRDAVRAKVEQCKAQRQWLVDQLSELPFVRKIYPSDANFLLVRMDNAYKVYREVAARGVVIRYRGSEIHCQDCVRITVGTPEENHRLMELLQAYC